ncbi:hypothetical protein RZP18_10660, partial [Citrobacter freundii]|nr:hypothetical protein [Citrobacter freundii]MEB0564733.1 hypothetical protein [Citrobacter freundii]
KIGPDPRNFNQRVSLGRNDLLIRTFPNGQNWKVKEFNNVQGAYKGKETKWVATKESQGTIHSHPIGSNEARKLTK